MLEKKQKKQKNIFFIHITSNNKFTEINILIKD